MGQTKFYRRPFLEWGVAKKPLPGQKSSGDAHLVSLYKNGGLVAVVDGLGHGEDAMTAARQAVTVLEEHATESVTELIKRCDAALRSTRGAVITLASFNALLNTLTWLGVGNVEGRLLREKQQPVPTLETVMLLGGVVGYQLPSLHATMIPVHSGDILLMASDGIHPDFAKALPPGEPPSQLAQWILENYWKGNDDALVLAARYHGNSIP